MKLKKSNSLFWDTSKDPVDFPEIVKNKFFPLSITNRKKFVMWLGNVSKNFSNNINWWIQIPLSRDPYKSNLFKNVIIIEVLKDKNIRNKIAFLIVESKNIKKIILKNKLVNNKTKIIVRERRNYVKIIKSIFFVSALFFLIKILVRFRKNNIQNNPILVDTFVDHREFKNDLIFPSLEKIFRSKNVYNYWFIPTFLTNKNFSNIIRNINLMKKKKYIFKESLLNFKEYFKIVLKIVFKKKYNCNFLNFKRIDYTNFINEELVSKKEFHTEFHSRMNYLVIKKLSQNLISIKKMITRFENQSVDKAWNYSLRKFFPKSEIYGYQGFTYYPHLLHQSPTKYEEKANLLPHKIIITSKLFKRARLEFIKDKKTLIGPNLNNQNIFTNKKKKNKYKYVLALCGIKSLDKKMCEWTFSAISQDKSKSLIIKPHPILPIKKIIKEIPREIRNQISITEEDTKNLLNKTNVIISSGPTSIILESISFGCKLIYLVLDPYDNLISKKIPKINKYMYFVKNKNALLSNMNILVRKKVFIKKNKIKNLFFTKISNKNINMFL